MFRGSQSCFFWSPCCAGTIADYYDEHNIVRKDLGPPPANLDYSISCADLLEKSKQALCSGYNVSYFFFFSILPIEINGAW